MPTPRPSCSLNPSAVPSQSNVTPMKAFVHEVLRRSRTSCSILQTALCYLEAVRYKVPDIVRQEKKGSGIRGEVDQSSRIIQADDPAGEPINEDVNIDDFIYTSHLGNVENHGIEVPIPPIRETSLATSGVSSWQLQDPPPHVASIPKKQPSREPLPTLPPLPSPLLCPRRTFLASLILASRFVQEKAHSNRAWAKLVGLPAREIGRCERALGEALDWRLWVGKPPSKPSRCDEDIPLRGRDHALATASQQQPYERTVPLAPPYPPGPIVQPFAVATRGPSRPSLPSLPIAINKQTTVAYLPSIHERTPRTHTEPHMSDASTSVSLPCTQKGGSACSTAGHMDSRDRWPLPFPDARKRDEMANNEPPPWGGARDRDHTSRREAQGQTASGEEDGGEDRPTLPYYCAGRTTITLPDLMVSPASGAADVPVAEDFGTGLCRR
ncbi:hypothetical protein BV25DRAFT_1915818 [Artomyces pyxidatus]|uniref:Uncharacterized protein n=1 Tax=Artomyces pyxidatus TaxID=48021 RepID=A0ACB8T3G3_9AGAM|nr:hypothetical protein BV25DRAFT_1915818 [Artomyces pyxidatus]